MEKMPDSKAPTLMAGYGHFITRPGGQMTPLIAVDELPISLRLVGVPMYLTAADTDGLRSAGVATRAAKPFALEKDQDDVENEIENNNNNGAKGQAPTNNKPKGRDPRRGGDGSKIPSDEDIRKRIEQAFGPGPTSGSSNRYNPTTPGLLGRKVFCTHWMRTGECDFVQQGCMFVHKLPDLDTMQKLNMRAYPRWFREQTREYQEANALDFNPAGLQDPCHRFENHIRSHNAGNWREQPGQFTTGGGNNKENSYLNAQQRSYQPHPPVVTQYPRPPNINHRQMWLNQPQNVYPLAMERQDFTQNNMQPPHIPPNGFMPPGRVGNLHIPPPQRNPYPQSIGQQFGEQFIHGSGTPRNLGPPPSIAMSQISDYSDHSVPQTPVASTPVGYGRSEAGTPSSIGHLDHYQTLTPTPYVPHLNTHIVSPETYGRPAKPMYRDLYDGAPPAPPPVHKAGSYFTVPDVAKKATPPLLNGQVGGISHGKGIGQAKSMIHPNSNAAAAHGANGNRGGISNGNSNNAHNGNSNGFNHNGNRARNARGERRNNHASRIQGNQNKQQRDGILLDIEGK